MNPPEAYHRSPGLALYTGDALDVLTRLPDAAADTVVTSPPYWRLRDYGPVWTGGRPGCPHPVTTTMTGSADTPGPATTCRRCHAVRVDGQYGHEPTPDAYVATLTRVFAEVRRVLAPTGTLWLNLGDSYIARRTRTSPPRVAGTPAESGPARVLAAKNLWGMPWRVAFALQADGWILRNAVVWHKPNAMPEPVTDRLSSRHELVFLLVRQPRYYFDLDAVRAPLAGPEALAEGIVVGGSNKGRHGGVDSTRRRRGTSVYGAGKYDVPAPFADRKHGRAMRPTGRRHSAGHPRGTNPGDVWSISTRPLHDAHYAAYPVDLPLRAVAAGCPPGGTVLDPFSGAGTTALAATQLARSYVGIDLNPAFHDIALTRLGLRPAVDPQTGDEPSERAA